MRSPLPEDLATIADWPRLRRYRYFFEEVISTRQVWTLYKGRWAIAESNGLELFPLWPNSAFAIICANQQWQHFKPIQFNLDLLLKDIVDMMDHYLWFPSIFQTPTDTGTVINTQLLKDDFSAAM